ALPERHLIVRTGWVYGPDRVRRNFALRLVDNLRARRIVRVAADQFGCPTSTSDLALATRWLVDHHHTGTFHAVGPEYVDRVTLAREVCSAFDIDAGGVVPCSTSDLRQTAPRSLRVQLT